jgi:hypothetical protein
VRLRERVKQRERCFRRERGFERRWARAGGAGPVVGRRPVAGGAIFGGQNRLPARQGRSGSSCGAGLAPIGAENAGDALTGFERGRSGESETEREMLSEREREMPRERERRTERGYRGRE